MARRIQLKTHRHVIGPWNYALFAVQRITWDNRVGIPEMYYDTLKAGLFSQSIHVLNPLNPKIKIWILICCPYSFPKEVDGRSW